MVAKMTKAPTWGAKAPDETQNVTRSPAKDGPKAQAKLLPNMASPFKVPRCANRTVRFIARLMLE